MKKNNAQTAHDQCKVISRILGSIGLLPEIREERIREIQFLIDTGLYTIDPRKIADRMLLER